MAESKARLIAGNFSTVGRPVDVTGATGASGGGGGGGLDSALVTQLIDSSYVQLREGASGGVDSAGTLSLVGIDGIIREHSHTISANVTIDSAKNGLVAGPIFIDSGVTVTLNDSATLVIA